MSSGSGSGFGGSGGGIFGGSFVLRSVAVPVLALLAMCMYLRYKHQREQIDKQCRAARQEEEQRARQAEQQEEEEQKRETGSELDGEQVLANSMVLVKEEAEAVPVPGEEKDEVEEQTTGGLANGTLFYSDTDRTEQAAAGGAGGGAAAAGGGDDGSGHALSTTASIVSHQPANGATGNSCNSSKAAAAADDHVTSCVSAVTERPCLNVTNGLLSSHMRTTTSTTTSSSGSSSSSHSTSAVNGNGGSTDSTSDHKRQQKVADSVSGCCPAVCDTVSGIAHKAVTAVSVSQMGADGGGGDCNSSSQSLVHKSQNGVTLSSPRQHSAARPATDLPLCNSGSSNGTTITRFSATDMANTEATRQPAAATATTTAVTTATTAATATIAAATATIAAATTTTTASDGAAVLSSHSYDSKPSAASAANSVTSAANSVSSAANSVTSAANSVSSAANSVSHVIVTSQSPPDTCQRSSDSGQGASPSSTENHCSGATTFHPSPPLLPSPHCPSTAPSPSAAATATAAAADSTTGNNGSNGAGGGGGGDSADSLPLPAATKSATSATNGGGGGDCGANGAPGGGVGGDDLSSITSYEFLMPEKLCGRLIGRGGSFVNQLHSRTGVHVTLQAIPFRSAFKNCLLVGRPDQIKACLGLIREKFPESKFPSVILEPVSAAAASLVNVPVPIPQSHQLHLPPLFTSAVLVSAIVTPAHLFVQQHTHPTFCSLQSLDVQLSQWYGGAASSSSSVAPRQPHSAVGAPAAPPPPPPLPQPIPINSVLVARIEPYGWFRAVCVDSSLTLPPPPRPPSAATAADGGLMVDVPECDESAQLPPVPAVRIRLADHGGYMTVPAAECRQMHTDFMTLPFQAEECYLADIVPASDDGWTGDAFAVFDQLIGDRALEAQVVGVNADGVPCINLYIVSTTQFGNAAISLVNQMLVDRGVARWMEPM